MAATTHIAHYAFQPTVNVVNKNKTTQTKLKANFLAIAQIALYAFQHQQQTFQKTNIGTFAAILRDTHAKSY